VNGWNAERFQHCDRGTVRLAVGNPEADRAPAQVDNGLDPRPCASDELKRHDPQCRDRAKLIEPLGGGPQLSRECQKGRLRRIDHDVGLAELNLDQSAGAARAFDRNQVDVWQGAAVFPYEAELVKRPAAADEEPDNRLPVGSPRRGRRQGDQAEEQGDWREGSKIHAAAPVNFA
jgi:hypothetical protein